MNADEVKKKKVNYLKLSYDYIHPHDFKSWCGFIFRLPRAFYRLWKMGAL